MAKKQEKKHNFYELDNIEQAEYLYNTLDDFNDKLSSFIDKFEEFKKNVKALEREKEDAEEALRDYEENDFHFSPTNLREECIAEGFVQALKWLQDGKIHPEKLEIINDKIREHVEKR